MNQLISVAGPVVAIFAILLLALPSYVGVLKQRGFAMGMLIIVVLGIFALGLETIGLKTGYPFGKFTYGGALGYRILGVTPWTVAFAYTPLVLSAFWLTSKITKNGFRALLVALLVAGMYAILGPALSRMGLWQWESQGIYYGMPVFTFVGRFISTLVAAWLLAKMWGEESVRRSVAYSGFAIIWFWSGVNLGLQQWIPGGIGIVAGLIILLIMRLEKKRE